MAFCSRCGSYVPDGNSVCSACGAPLQPNPQPNMYYPPVNRMGGGYRANIRRRDIAVAIILTIVTCGIYGIVWFFGLAADLNTAAPDPNDKEPGIIFLLSLVTCGIYGLIWVYAAGQKVDKIRQMNGEAPSDSALIYLLLSLFGFGIVSYALVQSELNKVAMDARP